MATSNTERIPEVCGELVALDISSPRCLNSQALLGASSLPQARDPTRHSSSFRPIAGAQHHKKPGKAKLRQRTRQNPTGQNSGLVFRSGLLTSERRFQRGRAPFGSTSRFPAEPGSSWKVIAGRATPPCRCPEKGENRGQARQPPAPSTPPCPPLGEGPEPGGLRGSAYQRAEDTQGLAGTLAGNSSLKINEPEVLSSELIETERTCAGSLLTTRQQRLLPLQLFRPGSLLQPLEPQRLLVTSQPRSSSRRKRGRAGHHHAPPRLHLRASHSARSRIRLN